jgi:acetyltransferase-like isoleucine patch superfamily enzyme
MPVRSIANLLLFALPHSALKTQLLRVAGHTIAASAKIGPCLVVRCDQFELAPHARVGAFNVFKSVASVKLGQGAIIGSFNWFGAGSEFKPVERRRLLLGRESAITSRHYFDCSGGIVIGELTTIAGLGTTILTHEINLKTNRQVASEVRIGDACFVGSSSTFLMGSALPSRSVLGAGSVLTRTNEDRLPGLWAGVPATWRKATGGAYFSRDHGPVDAD